MYKFMVTADYHYPGWEWHVDFFVIWGWKIAGTGSREPGIEPTTLGPSSQSDAYDLSSKATRIKFKIIVD